MKRFLLFSLMLMFIALTGKVDAQVNLTIIGTHQDGEVWISADDGEFENDSLDKLDDDDLDMGWEGEDLNVMTTYLRFQNVQIAKGAVIDSAILHLYAHEDEADEAKVTIFAEDTDNSALFSETEAITDRTWTSASVEWDITEEWTMWQAYKSPDIKAVIEAVINRSGWAEGNALTIFLRGEDQGASLLDNARDFESFENIEDPDDGGDGLHHPERIPVLKVYLHEETTDVKTIGSSPNALVFPNPNNGTFSVSVGNEGTAFLTISNMSGILVYSKDIAAGNALVDVSHLSSGVYIANIRQDQNNWNSVFVIE